mmetsp:Transcript_12613/g.18383  ORF Transcript_12613/g.18383 Transcript_12613/m.18383 type:complete len:251 (-) Transcript_12613:981-1733(-)
MVSTMSSRSRWNSCWRSFTSEEAAWYLLQSFLSLAFLVSISSWSEEKRWLSRRPSSSFSFRRLSRSISCLRRWSTSCWALMSSCSCLVACSIIWLPITKRSSMPFSFLSSLCCFSLARLCLDCCCLRASISCCFSLSASSFWASTLRISSSALLSSSSFSFSSCSSSCLIFSESSTYTVFSTTPAGPPIIWLAIEGSIPPPPWSSSAAFSFWISSWYSLSSASLGSSLSFGLFWMLLALLAYLSVEMVSS